MPETSPFEGDGFPSGAAVPSVRVAAVNRAAVNPDGAYVLYWMVAFRRLHWNYSLQRAVEWARRLSRPLLILEALRCDYPYASDRFHQFIIEGMAEKSRALAGSPVGYFPYADRKPGEGRGLLRHLAERACVVVTDDYPCFFLPRMLETAGPRLGVRLEKVDSNGLFPMRATERLFGRAFDFRRFLHQELPNHLRELAKPDPLSDAGLTDFGPLTPDLTGRWSQLGDSDFSEPGTWISRLPIDHSVPAVSLRGGEMPARERWRSFLDEGLEPYSDRRNEPEADATSRLSPWIHFGHLSTQQMVHEILEQQGVRPVPVADRSRLGRVIGWWGLSPSAQAFVDQLVTWRELGFNFCSLRDDYDQYESLPDWVRASLERHAADPRPHLYDLEELERGETADPLWNAAQMQLVREGWIHNYLRMLWGKKILEWSPTPQEAADRMIFLNDKYALDGRDPNSYTGIFWCLGRYDRPWAPERPVFGLIRYMTSESTARKFRVKDYIRRYSP